MNRIVPQKDGLYAIKLNNLGYIVPTDERFVQEDNIDGSLITGEDIQDVYTLVSYKGKGIFQEYYSLENALLCTSFLGEEPVPTEGVFANFNDEKLLTFENEQQRLAKFNFFKKLPLVVDASSLINVTSEIINEINSNNLGDSIRQYITRLKRDVILHDFEGIPFEESKKM